MTLSLPIEFFVAAMLVMFGMTYSANSFLNHKIKQARQRLADKTDNLKDNKPATESTLSGNADA